MHIVAFIFQRRTGMTLDEFHEYYEKVHGPKMVEILKDRGLISYDHYPTRQSGLGDPYIRASDVAFDALSIYTFESAEAADAAWPIPELVEDSLEFCNFDTMLTLPLTHRQVFSVKREREKND